MKPLVSVVATGCKLWPINPRVPTGNRPGLQHLLPENLFFPKCLGGDDVISQNEQYRCYGEQALASAKQATCEEEKAELLKSPKLGSNSPRSIATDEIEAEPTAATKLNEQEVVAATNGIH